MFLGRSLLSALDLLRPVGSYLAGALLAVAGLLGSGLRLLRGAVASLLAGIGRFCLAADRLITPARGIGLVTVISAGLLIASQFIDFRAIEIGQPGYVAVETITHAPRVEQLTPFDSHSALLVVAGLTALGAGLISLLSRRRPLGLLIAAAGGLTIVIALAVDLPKALDTADAARAFSGVTAVLLSGFWIELAAGVILTVTGLATLLAPRPEPARRPRPSRPESSRHRSPLGSRA